MQKILIDTDVILDFFLNRTPYSDQAASLLSLCEENKIKGYVTSVIISNVYYLLRKTASHDKVTEKLSQLMLIIDVLLSDKNIIIQALKSNFKDFEDAIQNYSAEENGQIDIIVTRNFKDFRVSKLAVMPPDEFLRTFFNSKIF
jgi:predicted nucleic acid-binding protein